MKFDGKLSGFNERRTNHSFVNILEGILKIKIEAIRDFYYDQIGISLVSKVTSLQIEAEKKDLTIEANIVIPGIPEGHVIIVFLAHSLIPPDEWYFKHHLKMLMTYSGNLGSDVNEVCKAVKEHQGALTDDMSSFLLPGK